MIKIIKLRVISKIKLSLILMLLPGCVHTAENNLPEFTAYSVPQSDAVLGEIDFTSHTDATNFRTRLEYNLYEPANFAGHYIVTSWGCGTMCQMVAIIDVLDGDVFFPFTTSMGVCFQVASSLIITNPLDEFTIEDFGEDMPDWLKNSYYTWDAEQMTLLEETRQVAYLGCESL